MLAIAGNPPLCTITHLGNRGHLQGNNLIKNGFISMQNRLVLPDVFALNRLHICFMWLDVTYLTPGNTGVAHKALM
jgi:hypothetical protein